MPFSVATPAVEEQEIFSWKPFTRADVSEVYELMQTVNRVDNNDHNETLDDVEREFDDPWSNPLTDGRIIRTVRGTLAAFARVFVNPKPESENVAYVWSEITPEARGQGLEQEMLEWMEHRAAERLAEVAQEHQAEQLPRVIRTDAPASNARAIALYEANDYAHARSFFKMERDLREPLPDKTLPEGLILRLYGEDIDEKLRLAFNESFGDHWGHQEITPAEWQPFVMQRSDVRRDLSLVVMDGDEIAAFCINCERVAENERLGIRRGWITKLGTRRTWRKRGLATFLLVESMRRFQAEGFDWAGLGVDAENLTGALALYENLGFRAYKTRHVWEKRVL